MANVNYGKANTIFANGIQQLYNDITSNTDKDYLFNKVFTDDWENNWFQSVLAQAEAQMRAEGRPQIYINEALAQFRAQAISYTNNLKAWHSANMKDYVPGGLPDDNKGDDSLTKLEGSENPAGEGVKDETGNSALADMQKAIQTGLQQQQTQAQDTAKNAAAAGVSKSQAGTLSDQATQQQQTQNVGAMYAANNSQRASTQADYLEKMQEVANLEQQAKWAKQAESSSILSGALSGGSTGLGLGATIFGAVGAASGGGGAGAAATTATDTSDERMKKAPEAPRACNKERECPRGMLNDSIDEKEMRKMIKQFKDLYTRVKKLKEAK